MNHNALKKIFIKSLLTFLVFGGALNIVARNIPTHPRAITYKDCDYYFAVQNGYTSIYEINQDLINNQTKSTYKTWGTVTRTFESTNNLLNLYVQSTDKYGATSGIYIYQSTKTDISVGNVLTITGKAEKYNNLPEFINPTIEIDQVTNEFPVEAYVTQADFWRNGTSSISQEFLFAQTMGSRQLRINGGIISYVSSGNATLTIEDVVVPLYYANGSTTSAIDSKILKLNNKIVDVIGHLHCYISGYTVKMQLLLRDVSEIISDEVVGEKVILNSASGYMVGTYSTGNYGKYTLSSVQYEHYRALRSSGNLMSLLPFQSDISLIGAPGAFYNISSLGEIVSMTITYSTDLSAGLSPIVSLGDSPLGMTNYELAPSTSLTSLTLNALSDSYFRIETTELILTITSIELTISDANINPSFSYLPTQNKRINPVVYEGSLFEGATVSVPMDGYYSGSTFYVTEEKILTYYSYSYINQNPALASVASYTDIKDIAAYFVAFKTWPANYVLKNNYYAAQNLFDNDARCVSTYSRTDGYATAVPYQVGNSGTPLYHELDVAILNTYSSNNRGVGRVVVWEYGFNASGYDSSPVAVYTDDHYATFQEYLNDGTYGTRFNAEMKLTPYVWGPSLTI